MSSAGILIVVVQPYLDDYFFHFYAGSHDERIASFYAIGRDETFLDLGQRLGAPLHGKLGRSTDWNSNILWPPDLAGQKQFDTVAYQETGLLRRLVSRILPRVVNRTRPEVLAFLASRSWAPAPEARA